MQKAVAFAAAFFSVCVKDKKIMSKADLFGSRIFIDNQAEE